jgi:hypothetical protein
MLGRSAREKLTPGGTVGENNILYLRQPLTKRHCSPKKSSKSNTTFPIATKIRIDCYYTFAHSYSSNYDIKKG